MAASVDQRTVVLVEGVSDQRALEALARAGAETLPLKASQSWRWVAPRPSVGSWSCSGRKGSTSNWPVFVTPARSENPRGLERAGLGSDLTRAEMEALGFYVCDADLEDELIRALGAAAVEKVIDAQGELRSFRTLQRQPAQQGWTKERQLRRFMGSRGGRKVHYRVCWSTSWIWPTCHDRSTVYWPTSNVRGHGDLMRVSDDARLARAHRARRGARLRASVALRHAAAESRRVDDAGAGRRADGAHRPRAGGARAPRCATRW